MNGGFKDIILEDVYDELCDRYEYAACPPANKQQNTAASKGGAAPRQQKSTPPKPPTPPAAPKPKAKKPACGSQPQTAQTYGEQCPPGMYFCTDAKKCKPVPEGKALTDSGWLVDMSEYDFAKGTGKPCGASHISSSYVCRLDAEERKAMTKDLMAKGASKAKLDRLSDEQISRVADAMGKGAKAADAEKEAIVRRAGGDELSDKEVAERVKTLQDYEKKYGEARMENLANEIVTMSEVSPDVYVYKKTPRPDEIEAIQGSKEIQGKLERGFDNPASMQKGGENAVIKFKDVPDEDVEMAWALSTRNAQNSFKSAGGVPTKDAWTGVDKNGDNIHGSVSVVRGKALMKRWMEQNGKDGYSGLPLTLNNADLEHIKPFSLNGRNAEQPSNWLFVSRGLNNSKVDKDMVPFLTSFKKLDSVKEGEKHNAAVRSATAKGGKEELRAGVASKGFYV